MQQDAQGKAAKLAVACNDIICKLHFAISSDPFPSAMRDGDIQILLCLYVYTWRAGYVFYRALVNQQLCSGDVLYLLPNHLSFLCSITHIFF